MQLGGNITWTECSSTINPQIRADGVHVWPFVPSFPVSVTFQVFGECQPVRMNRHDYFEIIYVISGEIACQVAERSFMCEQGELIVIGSSLFHRMWRRTRSHPKIAALFFMPEVICELGADGDQAQFLAPFYLQDCKFPHQVCASTGIPAESFVLIRRINAALPATTSLARLSVLTYLRMLLILLVHHYIPYLDNRGLNDSQPPAGRRIAPLFEFLEKHYKQAIRVEDAADLLGTSKPHFMRLFKQVTGQPFKSYLNHYRIAKAQGLLASTHTPIAQLSQDVGFCDQSYFGSVFRRTVGMTPLTFRKRFGNSPADSHIHGIAQRP
jgi:AraC-like DNA-binding protein